MVLRAELKRVTPDSAPIVDVALASSNSQLHSVAANRIITVTTQLYVPTQECGHPHRRCRRENRYDRAIRIESKIEKQLLRWFYLPARGRLNRCLVNTVKSNRRNLSWTADGQACECKRSQRDAAASCAREHTSNENKMSDGGRGRASLGLKVWKSSQKVEGTTVRRSLHRMVRSLWIYWRPWRNDLSAAP